MITTYTEQEIETKFRSEYERIFIEEEGYSAEYAKKKAFSKDLDIDVEVSTDCIKVTAGQMYECPPINFSFLMTLAEFFGTKNINDDERFAWSGCETCDYRSSYGYTLTIRPEKKVA